MSTPYEKWKAITDEMYAGNIQPIDATDKLISLLSEDNTKIRGNGHNLKARSYWVYDKEDWVTKDKKPLGLGLIYEKPDGTKTQDIFIANPDGHIEKYYSEMDLVPKYPSMKGVHKSNLPILK